jgi:hypothetical protein
MANHKSSYFQSRLLCEHLFGALEKRLGPLKYEQGNEKCLIRGNGNVFALVNRHIKNYGGIEVWFLGSADDAISVAGLTIHKRTNIDSAGRHYGGRFTIRSEKQIKEAVELLSTISYPKSLKE